MNEPNTLKSILLKQMNHIQTDPLANQWTTCHQIVRVEWTNESYSSNIWFVKNETIFKATTKWIVHETNDSTANTKKDKFH